MAEWSRRINTIYREGLRKQSGWAMAFGDSFHTQEDSKVWLWQSLKVTTKVTVQVST